MTSSTSIMLQLCQINISGLSQHSHLAINKYNNSIGNHVLALQETLISPENQDTALPIFTNMESFYFKNDRGVCTSIKTNFVPQRIPELEDNVSDALWVSFNVNSSIYLLGNFYVNPNSTSNTLKAATENIKSAFHFSKKYKIKNVLILGDFNCRHSKWGDTLTNKLGELLDEFTTSQNLLGLSPSTFTFKSINGGSVIDLAFATPTISKTYHSSSVDQNVELFSGAPLRGHFPVIHQFKNQGVPIQTKDSPTYYMDLQNTDWKKWKAELASELQQLSDNHTYTESPKDLWESFNYCISEVNERIIPYKKVSVHSKPFWTTDLTQLSYNVQSAKKKWDSKSTPYNRKILDESKIIFANELIKAKNCWIRTKLENLNVKESQIFWKNYKRSIVGDSRECLGNLVENGVLYSSVQEKEQILYDTFFSGKHLMESTFDENFDKGIESHYEHIIQRRENEKMSFPFSKVTLDCGPSTNEHVPEIVWDSLNEEISMDEIYDALRHQKTTVKSFDCNNLHPSMLKHLPPEAICVLHRCFNLALNCEIWPWDISSVVFIKKQGKSNYLKAGAYRPISMSSYIGKLLERIIEKRIRKHCELEGILDDEQEGFRSARNTTRYLYKLIANLKEAQKKKFTSFLLCIDFEKAFDSVWLKGLFVKLYQWNIKGKILGLLHSFLFNRKVRLIVNKNLGSSRKCNEYGVPQGSVLSPLLFIMFISDMLNFKNPSFNKDISDLCKEHSSVYKYADDGSVLIVHPDPIVCNKIAQEFCNHISNWCSRWKLIVNCEKDKTECLVIKPVKHSPVDFQNLKQLVITGKKVNFANSTRVLGIDVDDQLNFNLHSSQLLKRCWYSWYKITRGSTRARGLNISSLVILFKAVIIPKLFYGAPIWFNDVNQKKFKKFYAKVCLKISGSTHYSPQGITLLAMGLEPLAIIYNIICIKFILKALSSDVNMSGIIHQIEGSRGHPFYKHIVMVKDYLSTKSETLNNIINGRNSALCSLLMIDGDNFHYQEADIRREKLKLWNIYFISEADQKSQYIMNPDGTQLLSILQFNPIHHKTLFPRSSKRSTDTKVMSLLHGHDLTFGSFRYSTQASHSPSCSICHGSKDNNLHQLMVCPRFNCFYRDKLQKLLRSSNLAHAVLTYNDSYHLVYLRKMAQIIIKQV